MTAPSAVTGEAHNPQKRGTGPLPAMKATGRTVTAMPDAERARLARDVAEAYVRGDAISVIAAATGNTEHTVRRLLIDAGVTLRTGGGGPRPGIVGASTAEWVAAYARGDSISTIAAAAGRGTSTVRKRLVGAGVVRRPARRNSLMPETERERLQQIAVDAYARGDSIRAIADTTGQGYGVVRNALIDAGVTLRPRGGPRERPPRRAVPLANWIAAYTRGDSLPAIAAVTGHSTRTVRRHLLLAGVTLRSARMTQAQRRRLRQTAAEAYARGDSIQTIADGTGHTYGIVRIVLIEAGTVLRPQGPAPRSPAGHSDPAVPAQPDLPGPVVAP